MVTVTEGARASRAQRRASIAARLLGPIEAQLAEGISFAAISVNKLCREIGIARTTFYAAFEGKSDLLSELVGEVLTDIGRIADEWWALPGDPQPAEIEAISLRVFEQFRERELLLSAVSQAAAYDPQIDATYRALFTAFAAKLEERIARSAPRAGHFEDLPTKHVAEMLVWMFERACNQLARGAEPEQLQRLARANAWIVSNAVYGSQSVAD